MTNFQTIIQTSENIKKPGKREIQEMIEKYTNNMEKDLTKQERDIFAKMYKFFMPTKPKNIKTIFDWVALAMSKDDHRYHLNFIYVTFTRIMATDGHRLHIADNVNNLEPGFYNTNGDKVHNEDFAKYPDIDRVIPDPVDSERETFNSLNELQEDFMTITGITAKRYKTVNDKEVVINYSFIQNVLSAPEALSFISIGTKRDSVRFDFKKHGMKAVIMPMNPVN